MNAATNIFYARWFIVGLMLGLVALAGLGRRAVASEFHGIFHAPQARSPEGNYYPTVGELCANVRAHCRPEQVLTKFGGRKLAALVAGEIRALAARQGYF